MKAPKFKPEKKIATMDSFKGQRDAQMKAVASKKVGFDRATYHAGKVASAQRDVQGNVLLPSQRKSGIGSY